MTTTDKSPIEPNRRDAAEYLERIDTKTRGVAVLDAPGSASGGRRSARR
ncbi:hypothetical protein [Kaistia sp. MMO-174]